MSSHHTLSQIFYEDVLDIIYSYCYSYSLDVRTCIKKIGNYIDDYENKCAYMNLVEPLVAVAEKYKLYFSLLRQHKNFTIINHIFIPRQYGCNYHIAWFIHYAIFYLWVDIYYPFERIKMGRNNYMPSKKYSNSRKILYHIQLCEGEFRKNKDILNKIRCLKQLKRKKLLFN